MLGWELPPHNSGGLGVACFHLSKAIAQQGTSIDFVVPYSATHEEIDFMNVHNATNLSPLHKFGMGAYDSKFFTETINNKTTGELRTIRDIQSQYGEFVEDFAKKNDFDAIHAHDWLTMEAGMRAKELTNKPLVVHVHATEFDRAGGNEGNPIVHEIEYQGLIMADRIIAVSSITKQIIVEKYGIPADKVEVVYNAIDTLSFDQSYEYDQRTYRYLEGLKAEGYTVISAVTRLTIQKGLGNLVRAMAKAMKSTTALYYFLPVMANSVMNLFALQLILVSLTRYSSPGSSAVNSGATPTVSLTYSYSVLLASRLA